MYQPSFPTNPERKKKGQPEVPVTEIPVIHINEWLAIKILDTITKAYELMDGMGPGEGSADPHWATINSVEVGNIDEYGPPAELFSGQKMPISATRIEQGASPLLFAERLGIDKNDIMWEEKFYSRSDWREQFWQALSEDGYTPERLAIDGQAGFDLAVRTVKVENSSRVYTMYRREPDEFTDEYLDGVPAFYEKTYRQYHETAKREGVEIITQLGDSKLLKNTPSIITVGEGIAGLSAYYYREAQRELSLAINEITDEVKPHQEEVLAKRAAEMLSSRVKELGLAHVAFLYKAHGPFIDQKSKILTPFGEYTVRNLLNPGEEGRRVGIDHAHQPEKVREKMRRIAFEEADIQVLDVVAKLGVMISHVYVKNIRFDNKDLQLSKLSLDRVITEAELLTYCANGGAGIIPNGYFHSPDEIAIQYGFSHDIEGVVRFMKHIKETHGPSVLRKMYAAFDLWGSFFGFSTEEKKSKISHLKEEKGMTDEQISNIDFGDTFPNVSNYGIAKKTIIKAMAEAKFTPEEIAGFLIYNQKNILALKEKI